MDRPCAFRGESPRPACTETASANLRDSLQCSITKSRLGHELFNIGDFNRHERGKILITGCSHEDHIFQSNADMFIWNGHRWFNGEELSRLHGRSRQLHVMYLHPYRMAETVGPAGSIAFNKPRFRLFDFR